MSLEAVNYGRLKTGAHSPHDQPMQSAANREAQMIGGGTCAPGYFAGVSVGVA